MISNANRKWARREIYLSVSEDGLRFTRMAKLAVPTPPVAPGIEDLWRKFAEGIGSLQYPHAIERDGFLWIALSRNKTQIEVFRVALGEVDAIRKQD